jgi:hypothetical protein
MFRDVKEMIRQRTGIPLDQQLLVAEGLELEDDLPISEYGLDNNSIIDLISMGFDSSGTKNISVSKREISIRLNIYCGTFY